TCNFTPLQMLFLVPAKRLQAFFQGSAVVASVIGRFRLIRHELADRVWKLCFGDEVFATKIDRINAELSRGYIKQSFTKEIRFKTSWRAIGPDWCLIGHADGNIEFGRRNAIGAMQELRSLGRHDARIGAGICAHVAIDTSTQTKDSAIAAACDFELTI